MSEPATTTPPVAHGLVEHAMKGACGPECGKPGSMHEALERLEHIAHRMAVAAAEAGHGVPISSLGKDYPGLKQLRDQAMVVLVARAEILALVKALTEAKVIDHEAYRAGVVEAMEYLAAQRAPAVLQEILAQAAARAPIITLQAPPPPPAKQPTNEEVV